VRADTDALVKKLWSALLGEGYRPPDGSSQRTNWRELVTRWDDGVKRQAAPGWNYRLAGRLLVKVSCADDALRMYHKALQAAEGSDYARGLYPGRHGHCPPESRELS